MNQFPFRSPPNPMPEAMPMPKPVEISFITSDSRLSKAFRMRDGQLEKLPGGALHHGRGRRMRVSTGTELNEVLRQAGPRDALTCGITQEEDVCLASQELVQPGEITRTRSNFRYPEGPGIFFVDYDPLKTILAPEELDAHLQDICPAIGSATRVVRDSTGSHIIDMESGEVLVGRRGLHEYIFVMDATDLPRAGRVLFCRAILAGHGAPFITKSGIVFLRTLVDVAVFQEERLIFIGGADTEWPLTQLRPDALVFEGELLDTRVAIPDLTEEEKRRFHELERTILASAADEAAAVRAAWAEDRVDDHERRVGRTLTAQERQALRKRMENAASTNVLPDDFPLDTEKGILTVGDLLQDPANFDGLKMADPLEREYRSGEKLAMFHGKAVKRPYIWSHAHGGQVFTFASTPPPQPSTTTVPPSEQELIERFRDIPADTPADLLPQALAPVASELRRANPITASKVVKEAARHLGVGATVLTKQLKSIMQEQKDASEEEDKEPPELIIARGINELTRGELVCIEPPAKPTIMPVFHRVQPEGHLLLMRPEELHDLFNMVADRVLEPHEFNLVCWFLSTAVLEFRGGEILQRGVLCKNGFITFDLDNWFIPGRPKQPAVFYVPRTFIEDPAALPPLKSLKTIQAWEKWGVNIVALLELIARVLLTQQTGICYVFWGPGGEGKSTFLKYVTALVGKANVLPAEISDFSGDRRLRGIASMRGKLVAIFDDAPHNVFDILGTSVKEFCTADTLTGAAVYQESVAFPNTSLIVVLSNHPSIGKDRTRGSADRRNIHVWSHRIRFTTENQENVERAWIQDEDEMDVIFSTTVHLARRYLETGRWQFMQPVEEAVYIAEALTTVEARFLWQRFEQAEDHYISWDDIDAAYNKWWPDPDHRDPFSHDRFFTAMEVTWGGARCRRQEDNYRTRGVTGIKLLPKEKPAFTPKPGPSDVDLGFGQVVGGQKMPRIEGGPSSGEEKKYREADEGNIFQEPVKGAGAGVGFTGHLDPQQILSEPSEENAKYLEVYAGIRDLVPGRVRKENGLHIDRLTAMFPTKMAAFARPLIDELVAQGLVIFDGTWIRAVDPEEAL